MKKSKSSIIVLSCLALFLASFIYGYYYMGKNISQKPFYDNENQHQKNSNDKSMNSDKYDNLEIVKEEERISPNTSIEKNIYYTKCNHILTKVSKPDQQIINMNESQFEDYLHNNYSNVKLLSFSSEKIVLEEKRNNLCPNHYIIGEIEGKIAIFKINENGEKILNKIFENSSISLLKEIDQEKLKEGIIVDDEEELSDVLENFIS